jgi:hypothetical protein
MPETSSATAGDRRPARAAASPRSVAETSPVSGGETLVHGGDLARHVPGQHRGPEAGSVVLEPPVIAARCRNVEPARMG